LINSYICPRCGKPFPFIIKPTYRINKGLLLPHLKCFYCGHISQQKVDVLNAIWVWPLTLGLFAGVIYALQNITFRESPILYILIVGISLSLFFIGFRKGLKLVSVGKKHAQPKAASIWFMPAFGIASCLLFWGYYTQDWFHVALGIGIGLLIGIFVYYRAKK
jgi:hypothetical protein